MTRDIQDARERWINSGGFHACDESQCFDAVYTLAAAYMGQPDASESAIESAAYEALDWLSVEAERRTG